MIDLYRIALGVKAAPRCAVDGQSVDARGVDEFHIIDVQPVAVVQPVVSTESRVVTGRENDVTHSGSSVVLVVYRHFDERPLVVFGACAVPPLSHLFDGLVDAALVAVGRRADVRLLVGPLGGGATAHFVLVLVALGGACPGVVKQVKILFVGAWSCSFDPHGHGVGTMCPGDTSLCSGSSALDGQSFHVLPRLSETHISRPGGGDANRAYLPVGHVGTGAGSSGFLKHKGELHSYLRHVGTIPVDQLCVAVVGAAPVLKMTIGQLLCIRCHCCQ